MQRRFFIPLNIAAIMEHRINFKFWTKFWLTAIFAIILPVLGFVAFGLYMAGPTTLECARLESNRINCDLNTYHWLGLTKTTVTINNLTAAYLEKYDCSTTDSDGKTKHKTCEGVILETPTKDWRPDLAKPLASKIQSFIYSSQTQLKVQTFHWGFIVVFALIATLWGRIGFMGIWNSRFIPPEGPDEDDGEEDEEEDE